MPEAEPQAEKRKPQKRRKMEVGIEYPGGHIGCVKLTMWAVQTHMCTSLVPRPPREQIGSLVYVVTCVT